jgi:hypothetical protein
MPESNMELDMLIDAINPEINGMRMIGTKQ